VRKTLLLIGAEGFLGRHLREAAEAAGLRVLAASRRGEGDTSACDLLEPESVDACLEEAVPDLVVNAAGAPSVAASWEQPAEAFAANAVGVINLLEAVATRAPAAHLLCLSSAAVYGAPAAEEMPLGEGAAVAPVSPYGASKAAMEILCAQYARSSALSIAVIRAFNLVGPGQPPFHGASELARQIAEAERAGWTAAELKLGNPAARRDYTDVRDAARGLVEVSRQRLRGTYNLCSGRAFSAAELAEALAEATPLSVRTGLDPALARPVDPPSLIGDPGHLREASGFAAETPMSTSLADLLEWWRRQLASA
jgi:GDP-4-dehydro-6-deoxy-D-mannose reductase